MEELEEMLNTVNKLQDVFNKADDLISLPQIVVVGEQSAGKSSVLEHIVGKSFLPRGTGIVTRCPLVLQLVHDPQRQEKCATFQHDLSRELTDFTLITKEIEAQTDRLAGNNKGICETSINLKISSMSHINLTLVDLPGLTRVPVGDQPSDIEQQIRDLIMKYIKNLNSIILVVISANTDMATSESLKIAKTVDPAGARTLAVLTKLDLMDAGTDAWDMLQGKVISVGLGIIGVVNRSQQDIKDGKSIEDSLKHEADFLNKKYKSVADIHGCPYLTNTVQKLLLNHIKKSLPNLKKEIKNSLKIRKAELSLCKISKFENPSLLLNLIIQFVNLYTSAMRGASTHIQTDNLYGAARIRKLFTHNFDKEIDKINQNPLQGLDKAHILNTISNAKGMKEGIFPPEAAFASLTKKQLELFREPSLKCVDLVYEELEEISQTILEDKKLQLGQYPNLKIKFSEVVASLLQAHLPKTNEFVNDFIDMEKHNPDFSPEKTQLFKVESNSSGRYYSLHLKYPLQSHDQVGNDTDYFLTVKFIKQFMSTESKMVKTMIQRAINFYLIEPVLDQLHEKLIVEVYEKRNENLFHESFETINKRNYILGEIAKLEEGVNILNSSSSKLTDFTKGLKFPTLDGTHQRPITHSSPAKKVKQI